jgi:hypothetical protein
MKFISVIITQSNDLNSQLKYQTSCELSKNVVNSRRVVVLKKLIVVKYSRCSLSPIDSEGAVPCSRESAAGFYPVDYQITPVYTLIFT